jgi:hypothetical protein
VGVATRMSERERELHMWCARSEPDEGRCPYDRRRARSECGLCVSVLVVSAAWPHGCEGCVLPEMGNSVGACQLGYCVRSVACRVRVRGNCQLGSRGDARCRACRPRGGRGAWAMMDTAAGGRGRAAERKRDGRAPGERPAYRTTALQDTSNLTSVKCHTAQRVRSPFHDERSSAA